MREIGKGQFFIDGKPVGYVDDIKIEPKFNTSSTNLANLPFDYLRRGASFSGKAKMNQLGLAQLFGYRVIPNQFMCDRVQCRMNKNKRINKKWAKRYGYKEIPWDNMLVVERTIYAHPDTIKRMEESLDGM